MAYLLGLNLGKKIHLITLVYAMSRGIANSHIEFSMMTLSTRNFAITVVSMNHGKTANHGNESRAPEDPAK
jgi:hypothetical protein